MFPDFYATSAQVLPVLMLALIWESRFLDRLGQQNRHTRREDPDGVRFWTRPRVRAYSIFIVSTIMGGLTLSLLVLADYVAPGPVPRTLLAVCLALAVATLLTRVVVDILAATRPTDPPNAGHRPNSTGAPAGSPAGAAGDGEAK
ncbi:hypothetical protein ACGFIK_22830 [Micromonospora sp. NPDC048871]|uniref:hypothetical protein n=1 Tax=unclassified Micromonospora TaxID=2617518 RepID=UPI002E13B7E7|nr:hypothetical protein OIE53_27610 [Micromonospora sp. NBC_01739]